MATKSRTPRWVASGIFATALLAAAAPAHAAGGWSRHTFGSRVGHFRSARPFFPHIRSFGYARFDRPYFASRFYVSYPYDYDPYYYAASPYSYASPYYYAARPYSYAPRPYYYSARRAYWPRAVYGHRQFRGYRY
jgi:hypothetical protein